MPIIRQIVKTYRDIGTKTEILPARWVLTAARSHTCLSDEAHFVCTRGDYRTAS